MVNKKLITYILVGVFISLVLYMTYFLGVFSNDFKKSYELDSLRDYAISKNLSFETNTLYGDASDLNIPEFHKFIESIYKYDVNSTDCKYWSLFWALYFEKNNFDYEFITTEKHIFNIVKFKDSYCIADLNILECFYYN